jgi:CP family cyanate transporter-like MFS transporter
MNPAQAGWMLFLYQAVELVVGLLMPVVIRGRITDARVAVGASALVAAGFLLLVVTPGLVVVSCVVLGVGSGAVLVLAFSFQSKRANGQAQAAALAGMAQSIGYLIAAAGPLILGVLHAATANWTASLFVLGVASVAMGFFGYASGQQKHLRAERTPITRYKTDDHAN